MAFFLSLSGCFFLPKTVVFQTYDLSIPKETLSLHKKKIGQLVIREPIALKTLDSENIIIKPNSFSVYYLDRAQWADRLPKIVQARFIQAFQDSGFFVGVGNPNEGFVADYEIIPELRHFEVKLEHKKRIASVEIFVKIVDDKIGKVLHSGTFKTEISFSGSENIVFVKEIDRAFIKTLSDILHWTVSFFS